MIRAGTVLAGRYRLEQRIGSGGMGEVWRAIDGVLSRTVAVKCLLDGRPDEPVFVEQFRAEARIMATISHPGVVEVYDFGDDPAAGVYLVMKYIDGESLAQTLARVGRLSVEATMRLVAEAAEALHAAHEKGVTHRDIKPGNLLLRPDGSVLVTDFGIARSAGAIGHTATGSLVGTAGYIAPERAMGQLATPASDIYALGIVAYRCLAGHLPFAGDSVVEVALRHIEDEPPPLSADLPTSVRAIVQRAMAKDPAQRWPSAAALATQARQVLDSLRQQPATASALPAPAPTRGQPTVRQRRRQRRPALAIAALVMALATVTTIVLSSPRDQQPQSLAITPGASMPSGHATNPVASLAATNPAPSSAPASPKASARNTALAGPENLTATAISHNTVRLRWTDKSAAEDGFTVIDGSTSRNVGANTTTYDWTGLAAATHTCFKVRAYNASGVSAYFPVAQTDWVCVTTLPGSGPAAPANLTATAISPGLIRLQWTDSSPDEDGFTITNGATSRNTGASTTTYNWDGLAPGTYMCFKIRAYNSSGVSAYDPPAESKWACVTTPAS